MTSTNEGQPRAAIIHADLDSFYASVAQRDDPRLRGRPVAVGGGVLLAASYEAKRLGVQPPMGARQARSLCPDLVVVPPQFEAYTAASRAVFAIFEDTTPHVQGLSIDEAFLDVSGLRRIDVPPAAIAARVRSRVREEVGLAITTGIARTPFLAKVASGVAKPDGLLLVEPAWESEFLAPLPLGRLWGVGPVTVRRLARFGLHTAGDVADLDREILVGLLGPGGGHHLYAAVHGLTHNRVEPGRGRRSIGAQHALGARARPWRETEAVLLSLVDKVSERLRAASRLASTVVLRLRYGDYTRASRSHRLGQPTDSTALIAETARGLLEREQAVIALRGLTLVGVALMDLTSGTAYQPMLGDVAGSLDETIDDVHARHGRSSLRRASLLGTRERAGFPGIG